MKAFLLAIAFAVIVAFGASQVLNSTYQKPAYAAFQTEGAKVTHPGDNLIVK
jgi:hypothetical protein